MASAAIFSPLGKPPTEHYLSSARTFLLSDQKFQPLVREFQYLGDTWKLLASQREDIAALTQGPRYTKLLSEWISHGRSGPITDILSGIVSIPVLMVVEICQYFQYLQQRGIGHREFMNEVKGLGGVQGYCGGLLPASAVACAEDEEEVIQLAATAMRVGLAIGAFGQLGDDEATPGATVMVLRARYPGQGEEIVAKFPGVSSLRHTCLPNLAPHSPLTAHLLVLHISRDRPQEYQYRGARACLGRTGGVRSRRGHTRTENAPPW